MLKVSVIIPNYNHARYLRQRIDSVLGQTYQDFEVILLDDCSTDGSRSVLQEYAGDPRVRLEFNEKNSGCTFKQWNKGVRLARGEYIWIAESDDYADERLLERLVKVLDEEPEVTFAYCRSWRINRGGQTNGFADWYRSQFDPQRWTSDFRADGVQACAATLIYANAVPNASAVVFRRSIYERVGGAVENLQVCGDWKLWVLMALEGKIAYICEPLNHYREHDTTVRITMERGGRGIFEHFGMLRWMLERVAPAEDVIDGAYKWVAGTWVYFVLNRRAPFKVRWAVLREALAIDPHALRRLIIGMLTVVRLKMKKEFRLLRQRLAGERS